MDATQDPKQDPIDAAFQAVETESGKAQPTPGQGEQVQNTQTVEGGSDPLKTPSTPEAVQKEDVGFASHPKWIERENKLKEAQKRAMDYERRLREMSSFLGSEDALKAYLDKQGFELKRRNAQQASLFEAIAQKKGWNLQGMDAEQRKQLEDLVDVIDSAAQTRFDALMQERLTPFNQTIQHIQAKESVTQDLESARALAEKYGVSFDEVVSPKLSAHLDELDGQDPRFSKKVSATEFTREFLLDYLREQSKLNSNQEKRDEKRKDAKPVTPANAPTVPQTKSKVPMYSRDPKGFDAAIDRAMDELGVRD